MLDKNGESLLKFLNNIIKDNNYKIIEIPTVLACFKNKDHVDENVLKNIVSDMVDRQYLSLKYSDSEVYCLSVLPKGRVYFNEETDLQKEIRKLKVKFYYFVFLASVASFLSAALAIVLFT